MKTVQFLGGLGNQMFQYAFYLALKRHFKNVKADISEFSYYTLHNGFELNEAFGLDLNLISSMEKKLYYNKDNEWIYQKLRKLLGLSHSVFTEIKEFEYDENIFSDRHSRYYIGYWQNEKYFKELRNILLEDFRYKKTLSAENSRLLTKIKNCNSVSIHIRRGDYIGHPLLGNICSNTYYLNAINFIGSRIKDPVYFVFSNDMKWCKENINVKSIYFCEENTEKNSVVDILLMSNCRSNIIANSTFSWWSAWLNQNPDKIVVAPSKWINAPHLNDYDVVPSSWFKVES